MLPELIETMRMIPTSRGRLVYGSGVPGFRSSGCGKTTWVLETLKQHQGACAFLRLEDRLEGLEQGVDGGIDLAWLKDQIPELILQPSPSGEALHPEAHSP